MPELQTSARGKTGSPTGPTVLLNQTSKDLHGDFPQLQQESHSPNTPLVPWGSTLREIWAHQQLDTKQHGCHCLVATTPLWPWATLPQRRLCHLTPGSELGNPDGGGGRLSWLQACRRLAEAGQGLPFQHSPTFTFYGRLLNGPASGSEGPRKPLQMPSFIQSSLPKQKSALPKRGSYYSTF